MQATALDAQTDKNQTWNFSVNVLDITFITLGFSIISRETVMPLLVSYLTDSKFAVGLIPALFSLGYLLPQLFTANFSEGLRYKLPFVMLVSAVLERLPYIAIGIVVWIFAVDSPSVTLIVLLGGVATAALGAGIATPAWYDMIAKVIPVRRRGIWSGLGHSLGALLGIGGALLAGQILEKYPYPNNFALLFGIASLFIVCSWGFLALNREPPSTDAKPALPMRSYLRRLPAIIRNNGNYRRFLLSRTTAQMGSMSIGFFLVYGVERFEIQGATVGVLTAILVGTQAAMNLLWGFVGDRYGHKVVLSTAAFCIALASILAWFAPSVLWLAPIFILVGVYMAADMVSGLNIILEFCRPQERPTYIGLTNTLLAPVVTVAPLLGGWLVAWVGFRPMFGVALLLATLGATFLAFWVGEPRMDQPGQSLHP